jgi:diguanylate cyclase (GGDEF)-like protein
MDADDSYDPTEISESVFDAASLKARIANLARQGLDRSMSEAALQALHAAQGEVQAAPPPAAAFSLAAVAEAASDLIMVTRADPAAPVPVVLYANPAFTRLTGQPPEAVVGGSWRLLLGPGSGHEVAENLEARLAAGSEAQACIPCHSGTGEAVRVQLRVAPMRDPVSGAITHFAWIGRVLASEGVTPQQMAEQMVGLADRDSATGLPNRAALLRAIEAELGTAVASRSRGPCLALFSIDGLEEVSRRLGEAARAAVLLGVADRLAENARRADFVSRTGEGEFGIHMRGVALRDAEAAAKRLCCAVASATIETPAGPVAVTVSAGVAEARREGGAEAAATVLAELLAAAEAKLRAAERAAPRHAEASAMP